MAATEAVRTYLVALRDIDSLRDDEAIEKKIADLEQTEDPIARLRIQQELQQLIAPSLEQAEKEFVAHAKSWADEAGISAGAFAAEGVSDAVLRRAGFSVGRGRRGSRRSPSAVSKRSAKRVSTDDVVVAMPDTTPFTMKQLGEVSGASAAVVRKAIAREKDAGRVQELGPDPEHAGPGRAPTLYKRV